MGILASLEQARKDEVGVAVVSDHNVLIATVTLDGEAACIVGV